VADGGSATVLTSAAVAVVLMVGVASLHLASAVLAAHRARAAADLSALAGAGTAHVEGRPRDGCAVAARVAAANDARLEDCTTGPAGEVSVRVSTAVGLPMPGAPGTATARARAGPAGVWTGARRGSPPP
jgi:secretion/DNA translocation related TadE-like protein